MSRRVCAASRRRVAPAAARRCDALTEWHRPPEPARRALVFPPKATLLLTLVPLVRITEPPMPAAC